MNSKSRSMKARPAVTLLAFAGSADTKSTDPTPKADVSAPTQDTAATKGDPAKRNDPKTVRADDKAQNKAKNKSADAIVPIANRVPN